MGNGLSRKSIGQRVSALLVALALAAMATLVAMPSVAIAASGHVTDASGGYEVEAYLHLAVDGEVVYCAENYTRRPSVGTYVYTREINRPVLDYILYHGYGLNGTSGYGVSGNDFRAATQMAVWWGVGENTSGISVKWPNGEANPGFKSDIDFAALQYACPAAASAAQSLYNDAVAYARGGGHLPERGTAVAWCVGWAPGQSLIGANAPKKGNLKIRKTVSAGSPANPDQTFVFSLRLADNDYHAVESNMPRGGSYATSVKSGSHFNVRDGEEIVVKDILVGSYQVQEFAPAGWTVTGSGTSGQIVADSTVSATVTNSYSAAGIWAPQATKIVPNRTMKSKQFAFELRKNSADGEVLQTRYADAGGTVTFSPITYDVSDHNKTYRYYIREVIPSGATVDPADGKTKYRGYSYDTHVTSYTVRVTDNGSGGMETEVVRNGSDEWVNEYHCEGKWRPQVEKKLVGRDLSAGEWGFELRRGDMSQAPIDTKHNDASGKVTFDQILFTEEDAGKTYQFLITEIQGDDPTVIYDTTVRTVTVKPVDNGDGTMKFVTNYESGKEFTNRLQPGSLEVRKVVVDGPAIATASFPVKVSLKTKAGQALSGNYAYTGSASGTVHDGSTIYLRANWAVTISDLPAGTQFSVSEGSLPSGYSLVGVTDSSGDPDDGQGEIEPTVTASATVTNTYAATGSFSLSAFKRLTGENIQAGQFSFTLRDEGGNEIERVTNDAAGKVTFSPISVSRSDVGTPAFYYITEDAGDRTDIIYDDHTVCYRIDVTDAGDGTLRCAKSTVSPDDHSDDPTPPIFENQVKPGRLAIKKVTDDPERDQGKAFHFTLSLMDETGEPVNIDLEGEPKSYEEYESLVASGTYGPPVSGESASAPQVIDAGDGADAGELAPAPAAPDVVTEPDRGSSDNRGYRIIVDSGQARAAEALGGDMMGELDGKALIGFVDAEACDAAIGGLEDAGATVTRDETISMTGVVPISGDGDAADGEATMAFVVSPDDNPMGSAAATAPTRAGDGQRPLIALIDTGAPEGHDGVSFAPGDDDPHDGNGHATAMYEAILAEDPEADVMFVKALDDSGYGSVSSLYAAIRHAMASGADIINLSLSAWAPDGMPAVEDALAEASSRGILVVGAAGNSGADVTLTIPGGVDTVLVMAAADADGKILDGQNRGATIDATIPAESSSYAAARASGWLSAHQLDVDAMTADGGPARKPTEYVLSAPQDGDDGDHDPSFRPAAWTDPKLYIGTHVSNIGSTPWQQSLETQPQYKKQSTHSSTVTGIYTTSWQRIENYALFYEKNSGPAGQIKYMSHMQDVGDTAWVTSKTTKPSSIGPLSPSATGNARSIEMIAAQWTNSSAAATYYDIKYKVHTSSSTEHGSATPAPGSPNKTFTGSNGSRAGTTGQNTALDNINVWLDPIDRNLTLNPNGGKFSAYTAAGNNIAAGRTTAYTMANKLEYGKTTHSTLGPKVTRTGYTLSGWYTATSGGSKIWNANGSFVTLANYWEENGHFIGKANVTVYARWTPNTYTITVNPDGGKWNNLTSNSTVSVTYDATTNSNLSAQSASASKAGYSYEGLYTQKNGQGVQVYKKNGAAVAGGTYWTSASAWKGTANLTVYPYWKPIDYTMKVTADNDANGEGYDQGANIQSFDIYKNGTSVGTFPGVFSVTGAHIGDAYEVRNIVLRDGYKVSGATIATGNGSLSTTDAAASYSYTVGSANSVVSINTEPSLYHIQFLKNTEDPLATGEMPDQDVIRAGTTALNRNSYYWPGYEFTKWSTRANGTGTSYADGASVSGTLAADGATVKLYAQWAKITNAKRTGDGLYDITVYANTVTVLDGIPAGTIWSVVENVPSGWVLVDEQNTSGTIASLGDQLATFQDAPRIMQYDEDTVSFRASAMKTIDGVAAGVPAGAASFTLREKDGPDIEAGVPCASNGRVSFAKVDLPVVGADQTATYHYEIVEVAGDDESLSYDTHVEDVTVTVTNEGGAGSVASVAYSGGRMMAVFDNTHRPGALAITKDAGVDGSGEFTFDVTFTKNGLPLPAGTYGEGDQSFVVGDGGIATVTVGANQTVTLGGIPTGYHYAIEERAQDGWSITGQEGDVGDIQSNVTATSTFTNEYGASGSVSLSVTKAMEGADLKAGAFEFELLDDRENVIGTAACAEDGTVSFPPIGYGVGDIGTHEYVVREVEGSDPAVIYDGHLAHVSVTVTDAGGGILDATATYAEDERQFTNRHRTTDLRIEKATGTDGSPDATFSFRVDLAFPDGIDASQRLSCTREPAAEDDPEDETITSGGTFSMGWGQAMIISGLPVGTEWTVTEVGEPDGWEASSQTTLRGEGVAGETGVARFENSYDSQGAWVPGVTKMLIGRDLEAGMFSFTLYDPDGEPVSTAANDADGSVTFPAVTFTHADSLREQPLLYTIRENEGDLADVTYDDRELTCGVTVIDAGDGTIVATSEFIDNDGTFYNEVKTGSLSITKEAVGTFAGQASEDALFEIDVELTGSDGEPLQGEYQWSFVSRDESSLDDAIAADAALSAADAEVFNDADPSHPAPVAQQRPAKVAEMAIEGGHATILLRAGDTAVIPSLPMGATFLVSERQATGFSLEDMEGEMGSVVADSTVEASVTNRYEAAGQWYPEAKKEIEGIDLEEGLFEFAIYDGATKVATATNSADGTVRFDPIQVTNVGTHTYRMVEEGYANPAHTLPGEVVFDGSEWEVTVTVTDTGLGTLKCDVAYGEGTEPPTFENEFRNPLPTGIRDGLTLASIVSVAASVLAIMAYVALRRRGQRRPGTPDGESGRPAGSLGSAGGRQGGRPSRMG